MGIDILKQLIEKSLTLRRLLYQKEMQVIKLGVMADAYLHIEIEDIVKEISKIESKISEKSKERGYFICKRCEVGSVQMKYLDNAILYCDYCDNSIEIEIYNGNIDEKEYTSYVISKISSILNDKINKTIGGLSIGGTVLLKVVSTLFNGSDLNSGNSINTISSYNNHKYDHNDDNNDDDDDDDDEYL